MRYLIGILILLVACKEPEISASSKALLIIDVQEFYYPGGVSELVNPEEAGEKAGRLLEDCRKNDFSVIHVRHDYEPGGNIHQDVQPLDEELVISKKEVNSFQGTSLLEVLKQRQVDTLVICGMQTHMCVESAVRAASDYGFTCVLVEDACATMDLEYEGETVKARDVHRSTLATLKRYAKVTTLDEFIGKK